MLSHNPWKCRIKIYLFTDEMEITQTQIQKEVGLLPLCPPGKDGESSGPLSCGIRKPTTSQREHLPCFSEGHVSSEKTAHRASPFIPLVIRLNGQILKTFLLSCLIKKVLILT